jgi:pimeloyl-ACP methyl ester carboxylesterase
MPALNPVPTFSFLSALSIAPWRPLQMLVRTTEARFRPSRLEPHSFTETRAQIAAVDKIARGSSPVGATIFRETGSGRVPTIVLGGMVPNAPEQVFLLRQFLLRSGDIYYVSYPHDGFPLELLCAQLSDLVAELVAAGKPPIIFAVSFGAGLALEWLRRSRAQGIEPLLAGLVLVSPVTCIADLIAPDAVKPTTLMGRALKPFLNKSSTTLNEATVEKSRAIFLRMFEAGAQNKAALRALMTPAEAERLREAVISTIRRTTADGACQRVLALNAMLSPTDYFSPSLLPLTTAPTLILFAEREDSVLDERAPALFAFERAPRAYFPDGAVQRVVARPGKAPVQHASLIFHAFEFLPPLQAFYHRIRRSQLAYAA